MIVSVLIPTYNEEKYIRATLDSLMDDFLRENGEILIIDGISTDHTLDIVQEYIREGFPIRILNNPKQAQCFALNQGIAAAGGNKIIRADAHSLYPPQYVKTLVELLDTAGAANVGGVMLPVGKTPVQQAIALAMRHPLGVGNARFHLGNFKGFVDTVYLGAFHKEIFNETGLYDTHCRTNEDAELNIRLLKKGKKIYLDSSIEVIYTPRDSFLKLAVQYFRYGKGRAYTTAKHRQITSFRQLAAPALVTALTASLIFTVWNPAAFLLWPLYFLAITAVTLSSHLPTPATPSIRFRMAVAVSIMHLTWGTGFILSFIKYLPLCLRFKGKKTIVHIVHIFS